VNMFLNYILKGLPKYTWITPTQLWTHCG
jgi:hypothetical protein